MKKWIALTVFVVILILIELFIPKPGRESKQNTLTDKTSSDLIIAGKPYRFEKIKQNVFVIHGPLSLPNKENAGFINNTALIVGKNGLIIIDPSGSYPAGRQILAQARRLSKKPFIASFNTHVHGDHWLGNQAFAKEYPDIKTYGHEEMIAQIKEGRGDYWVALMESLTEGASHPTKVSMPEFGVKHLQEINIDSEKFRIHSPTEKAHTSTDIMIEHLNSKTLFVGDNAFNQRLGFFDETSNIHDTIKNLEYVLTLDVDFYVPGHGKSGSAEYALKPYLNYLKTLVAEVKKGYDDDLLDYEIKPILRAKLVRYQDWFGFEEALGKDINKVYLEIEEIEE